MKTKGLTLAEAHASGRNYRRANHAVWTAYSRLGNHSQAKLILIEHVFATDYELEPEAKLLTRDEVSHALNVCWDSHNQMYTNQVLLDLLFGPEEDV